MRTRKPKDARPSAPFLQSVELQPDRVEDWGSYPFHLPFLRGLHVELAPLTFLIGENGSGKTTLIEAIADLCRLPIGGGGRTELADDLRSERPRSRLAAALRPSFRKRPWDGYFVRAENLVRLADLLEQREQDPDFLGNPYFAYGGRSLHERSHGEAFIALFEHRLQPGGILIMDEPEAALSPQRQLSLLAQLHAFLESGATQVIIATHSPILMTFPGARLLAISAEGVAEIRLEDTSHYQITRGILEHPERYWKHLRAAPESGDDGVD
jgi:predicted ATPase